MPDVWKKGEKYFCDKRITIFFRISIIHWNIKNVMRINPPLQDSTTARHRFSGAGVLQTVPATGIAGDIELTITKAEAGSLSSISQ